MLRIFALLFVLSGWAGAVVGAIVAAHWLTDAFEDLTARTVTEALQAAGQDWPQVDPDGTRVVLRGIAPSEAAQLRARDVAQQVLSPTRVTDASTVGEGAPTLLAQPEIVLLRAGDATTLTGRLTVTGGTDALVAFREQSEGTVTALNSTTPALPTESWVAHRDAAFALSPLVETGRLTATPSRLEVTGVAETPDAAEALEAALRTAVPEGVTARFYITAPAPIFSPFTFSARREAGTWKVDTCHLPVEANRPALLATLSAAGLPDAESCVAGRGAPSPNWAETLETTVGWLAAQETGSATLSDLDLALESATAAKAPELTDGYVVTLNAPQAEDVVEARKPSRLLFTRHASGSVSLSGPVSTPVAREAIVSYAQALFGAEGVISMLTVRGGEPPADTAQLLSALDLLHLLDEGSVEARPTGLSLTGAGGAPDITAQVEAARGTLPVDVDVRYRPRPTASAAGSSCSDDLAGAQAESRIQFAPSSAAITRDSGEVLDRLAAILRRCGTQRFEIAGYTDNQGSESLNLSLSRARAEAVLDALLARDVFLDRMVAMGYGEADPIADNDTEEGRSLNRRIEFRPLEDAE
ncbi:MAG: OmpA family protein [Pseudomonadota bacterium]